MSDSPARTRKPHAVLDLPSRRYKGMKIERLLGLSSAAGTVRMLEVGTGSGGIAHYFGTHAQLRCEVDAIDVHDSRQVWEGYRYHQVRGTALPFQDGSFDVVLSNHVIEHVGEAALQRHHLIELWRMLRPGGIGYLAVPSRWMLVEPHYRLPFLSWLPRPLADQYIRLTGKGDHYDCWPLTVARLEAMLTAAGFAYEQKTGEGLRLTYMLERPNALIYRWLFRWLPDEVFRSARRTFPTLIYILRKQGSMAPGEFLPDSSVRSPV